MTTKYDPPCFKIINDIIKAFLELWVLEKVKGFLLKQYSYWNTMTRRFIHDWVPKKRKRTLGLLWGYFLQVL
jgi:hypothetical protein